MGSNSNQAKYIIKKITSCEITNEIDNKYYSILIENPPKYLFIINKNTDTSQSITIDFEKIWGKN